MDNKELVNRFKEEIKKQHIAEKPENRERKKYQGDYGKGWCEAISYMRNYWIKKLDALVGSHEQ